MKIGYIGVSNDATKPLLDRYFIKPPTTGGGVSITSTLGENLKGWHECNYCHKKWRDLTKAIQHGRKVHDEDKP